MVASLRAWIEARDLPERRVVGFVARLGALLDRLFREDMIVKPWVEGRCNIYGSKGGGRVRVDVVCRLDDGRELRIGISGLMAKRKVYMSIELGD